MHSKLVGDTEPKKEVEQSIVQRHELLLKWAEITASERQSLLRAYIQEQIAQAIGISTCDLDVQQPLQYLGIDSLIAVKLRNRLRTDLEVDVLAVKFMEDSSVASLATQLSEQILSEDKEQLRQKAMSDDDWLEGEI